MGLFSRIGKGWRLGIASLKVIKKNKQLVLFPIISTLFLLFVIGSFMGLAYAKWGYDYPEMVQEGSLIDYVFAFITYLISYFVIVFFNVGLVHCTRMYLQGEKPTFKAGVQFSMTRIPAILGWATLSATVGLIIKAIQENSGTVGGIIASIIGIVWSIATFFVVPVLAYENVGPVEALKKSGKIMKEKWGESIGATFSFGILSFLGMLLFAIPIGFLLFLVHPVLGITVGILIVFFIQSIVSASEMVFITTIYQQLTGDSALDEEDWDANTIDDLFIQKKKKGIFS
ncbi:hypothetical protein DNU06_05800 [Putridiphycobacter roseus]|uniref:Glycerophosphoryl diester phosphodiesterase membrane domain-containing protein n=1 Tax=Putridiphycobacter roseus TaxID=2219161 RepID=A0A2W1N0M6_9FLAO|nr:DUF6159 family protein [Putridiphycobacter roseus]PZE18129.1 hypothetical protein DNU06_05800 [Putridiphycobacter roseus]